MQTIYLSLSIYLSFVSLSIYLSFRLSIYLFIYPSIYLSVFSSIYLFILFSVYLSVCFKVFFRHLNLKNKRRMCKSRIEVVYVFLTSHSGNRRREEKKRRIVKTSKPNELWKKPGPSYPMIWTRERARGTNEMEDEKKNKIKEQYRKKKENCNSGTNRKQVEVGRKYYTKVERKM